MLARLRRRLQGRRLLAPEVVQTSAMDCGPAALKCLLEGFRVPASYPRLQEACQTDVDGASIDTIEQIARSLGLEAEQVMLPADHVLLDSAQALPALVVVRRDNLTHFLVAWDRVGPFVQLMDPAVGRRWLRPEAFHEELYVHRQGVPSAGWREWAGTEEFLGSLTERLRALGIPEPVCGQLPRSAAMDPGWRGLATLDATTRMVADLARAGGIGRGPEALRLVETLTARAHHESDPLSLVPASYWSVLPADTEEAGGLVLSGAVLLRIRDRGARPAVAADPETTSPVTRSPNLTRALTEAPQRVMTDVWRFVRHDGVWLPALLGAALVLCAVGTIGEILLLRGFLEIHDVLSLREHRLVATSMLLGFVAALLVVELVVAGGVLRIGRRIEARLRAALSAKLPKLGDRYFHSRLVSDMAHRAHSLDAVRGLPALGASLARTSMQLIFTAIGLAWLDPPSAWIGALAAALALAIPLATAPMLAERELRQRSHAAALARHYLDGLLGLVAVRTHGAERAVRHRHETLLVEWARSSLHLLRGGVVVEGLQTLVGSTLAAWVVLDFVSRGSRPGGTLLLVYWALNQPALGRELAAIVQQFPAFRNILARVLEPLNAPEEADAPALPATHTSSGAAITLSAVQVQAAARPVLEDLDLTIQAGEHVAIVGRSGAGKSSLVGLLLGWRAPSAGRVIVDDAPLEGERLIELRRATAWLDPAVHLWNRSLFENLRYGDPTALISNIGSIFEMAELNEVLEKLPEGLQSPLGEGGRLTSGGEGQRVRFARALLRQPVRLALLDEPFRGLDRQQRHEMLARARERWNDATLICVTHDIDETLTFPRVLVLESGRIVEDGNPLVLARKPSRYAALLTAEHKVTTELWSGDRWRRWRLKDGNVTEDASRMEMPWTRRQRQG